MRAHFDAGEGAAGDLILAALIDAGAPEEKIRAGLSTLPLPMPEFSAPEVRVGGFRARRLQVGPTDDTVHRTLPDIVQILAAGELPPRARQRALQVFERLAAAEGRTHGIDPSEVHFHEVGARDAILDIVGGALALEFLGVTEVTFSPLGVGTGHVMAAHGSIPVPVPAVLELTRGFPLLRTDVPTEILTPTGAAILTTLGKPGGGVLTATALGVSAGRREAFGRVSLLRVSLGAATDESAPWAEDQVEVLETQLDDMNPEILPHVLEMLFAAGALDASLAPLLMKKGRSGHLLTVLAAPARAADIARTLFRETSTLGIRRRTQSRWVLRREAREVETPWGPVPIKVAFSASGLAHATPEHEALRALAERTGTPLIEVYRRVEACIRNIEYEIERPSGDSQ